MKLWDGNGNLFKLRVKVPILEEVNFGKVKLWDVEYFWTLFVFTFGRDCYCIQQSRPKMKTKSVQKCSTSQSFTLPRWHSFKIGTLVITLKHTYPRKLGHGSIHPFLPSKRLSSGALRIGFAVPGIEENTAGEPEEESVVCSNFSPASTIDGGWRLSSKGLGLAWHSHIFWLWGLPWQAGQLQQGKHTNRV